MDIPQICTSISSNLTRNLRLAATDDERQQYLSMALQEIGGKVVPFLNLLLAEGGEGSPMLHEARTAALDLATFVCIDFIRKCTNHRWGVSCLEELSAKCQEPQLKKKLVIYTNQLKKKWNTAEPGGSEPTPRALRLRQPLKVSSSGANVLRFTVFLGCAFYFIAHFDLTALIFPRWNEPKEKPQQQVLAGQQQDTAVPAPGSRPVQTQPENPVRLPEAPAGSFFTYTDKQSVVHIVDDLDKVPQGYRSGMSVSRPGAARSNVTPVVIRGNQVLVPVKLSLRGRSVDAQLLLDTGASVTTISESLAARLGVESSEVKAGQAKVADGRSVGSYSFWVDSLDVGSRSLPHVQASILSGSGGEGYDGLLGMNFLKNFRYHVDFNRSVIEWGG